MHIKIKNGKNQYTAFGGTFLISELCKRLGIESYIDSHLDGTGVNDNKKINIFANIIFNNFVKLYFIILFYHIFGSIRSTSYFYNSRMM